MESPRNRIVNALTDLEDEAKKFRKKLSDMNHHLIQQANDYEKRIEILVGERDKAEGELHRFIREHNFGAFETLRKKCDEAEAVQKKAEAEVAALNRELERWRHGVQIEGDYVCPLSEEVAKLKSFVSAFVEKANGLSE